MLSSEAREGWDISVLQLQIVGQDDLDPETGKVHLHLVQGHEAEDLAPAEDLVAAEAGPPARGHGPGGRQHRTSGSLTGGSGRGGRGRAPAARSASRPFVRGQLAVIGILQGAGGGQTPGRAQPGRGGKARMAAAPEARPGPDGAARPAKGSADMPPRARLLRPPP